MAKEKTKKNKTTEDFIFSNRYFDSVRQPLYALCFLLPLIILYEVGTIVVNTDQIAHMQSRVAAFTWIMGIASLIGVGQNIVWAFPGFVVVIITMFLHLASSYPWKIRFSWLCWMGFESMFLTIPLFGIGLIMNGSKSFSAGGIEHGYYARLITGIGAGIYEELFFRLILLGLLLMLFDDIMSLGHAVSIIAATLISSLMFSAHHYFGIDMSGQIITLEQIHTGSFLFRTAAGVYFAMVFYYRGYGITAGTHAFYNIFFFTFLS